MRGEHGFHLFFEYMLLPCGAVTKSKAETANACASESLNLRACCHKEEKISKLRLQEARAEAVVSWAKLQRVLTPAKP